jgi:hypothetical protein
MITLSEKDEGGTYKLYWDNGVYMGDAVVNVDGFYVFFPEHKNGYWDEGVFRSLLDTFTALNAEWNKQINEYFDAKDRTD